MNIEFSALSPLLHLIQMGVIAALWMRKPGEQAEEHIGDLESQVKVIQETLQHMPTSQELAVLEGNLKANQAMLNSLVAQLAGVASTVVRIESFLLQNRHQS